MIVRNKIETDSVREESLDSRFECTEFDMPVEIKTKTSQEFHGHRIWTSQRESTLELHLESKKKTRR